MERLVVAIVALTLSVELLISVRATISLLSSTVYVIAVVTHAFGVVHPVFVLAVGHLSASSPSFSR